MSLLQSRLILHGFICREFGFQDLDTMLETLRDVPVEFDIGGESSYKRTLQLSLTSATILVKGQFAEYDYNIIERSQQLGMTGEKGRSWKPYQYLALLFTEHYLNRYFSDPEQLCHDLNQEKTRYRLAREIPDYSIGDLQTVAFQSATGSGKTLLMHANILQYKYYINRSKGKLNNIILVTPNEQMSAQHKRDLEESGLRARLFSGDATSDLFSPVEIIDLNKLADKKGIKRVAVSDFGSDNLVLVDEGHLGASGRVWRERRQELSSGGFTFEYSATFNQVVNKGKKEVDLLHSYSKSLLFDYSYRHFYGDGYGKDYTILNLPDGAEDENSDTYLLGCLLIFYQQSHIWRDNNALWSDYNLARPLWVLLGKTVVGTSKLDEEARSDVIRFINFLAWVLANREDIQAKIEVLIQGQSGLLDNSGRDYFAGRFPYLPSNSNFIYDDLCDLVFHGTGRLRVVYLTGSEGELHLSVADNEPFGVVNIGDSTKLYRLLTEIPNPDFILHRDVGFASRLFERVEDVNSKVNIVIGARKFIAGWNSWRVSTMGLMHVGVGEGPEIIQMFGRGVRLKGWNLSLKRHRESGADLPSHSDQLAELERLYIFGLRSNYMQTFRELLEKEGVNIEQETFYLPVTWNFTDDMKLKTIRLREDRKYSLSDERPVLPNPFDNNRPIVTLDLYSRLQSVESEDETDASQEVGKTLFYFHDFVGLFDKMNIYHRLLLRKRQKGWHNLVIHLDTIDQLLDAEGWYELYLPPERGEITEFQQVLYLENIALDLITEYADKFWRRERRRWEHEQLEVVPLREDNPNNIVKYEISVDATKDALIEQAGELAETIFKGHFENKWYKDLKLGVIKIKAHAYQPLLYVSGDSIVRIQPAPLNLDEKRVVENLEEVSKSSSLLADKKLYLIRNLTRGHGFSFFDDFGYYPDFIIWLLDGDIQHLLFLDPKGLSRLGSREKSKIKVHHEIVNTEARVNEIDPSLRLHSYVLSVTPASKIDDGIRSVDEWKQDGVYFLEDPGCLDKVIENALG